jgi:hypothetical protein
MTDLEFNLGVIALFSIAVAGGILSNRFYISYRFRKLIRNGINNHEKDRSS